MDVLLSENVNEPPPLLTSSLRTHPADRYRKAGLDQRHLSDEPNNTRLFFGDAT